MIHPTAINILDTVDATITEKVEPSINTLDGRSALTTVRHLLRFVKIRVAEEGQILFDEIARLRALLGQTGDYLRTRPDAANQIARIDSALAAADIEAGRYPDLELVAEKVGALREAVYQALKYLQGIRDQAGGDSGYADVRAAIRAYVVWQNAEEDRLVAPAFYHQGPRR